jgi:hypothetical protein
VGGVIQAFGARARLNGSRSRLDWRLELPQGIFDSQKHDFPSGLAHVFRDPKHPAYGFNFYVKVEMWIVNVRSALQVHKMCSRIQILIAIAYVLDASFELFFLKRFSMVHAEWVAGCAISVILNKSFTCHRQPPRPYRRKLDLHQCYAVTR